jgi:hypothetical protein
MFSISSETKSDSSRYRVRKPIFFKIQKHLLEVERNFLLKLFLEDDLQVLGSFEAFLSNGDAQDMLHTLKIIVE